MNFHRLIGYAAGIACGAALIGAGAPIQAHAMGHMSTHHATVSHSAGHSTTHTATHRASSPHFNEEQHPIKTVSQARQSKLINTRAHFNQTAASRIFRANRMPSAYQSAYHRQSIIHNPWFWIFMMNHHRLNRQTQNNEEYLSGYKSGVRKGQLDLKTHRREHQNLTSQDEKTHSQTWQKGYYDGYSDAVTNNQAAVKTTK